MIHAPGRLAALVLLSLAVCAAAQTGAAAQPDRPDKAEYWAGEFETRQPQRPRLLIMVKFWAEGSGWRGELNIPPDAGISGSWDIKLLHMDARPEALEFIQPHPNPNAPPNHYFVQRTPPGSNSGQGWVSLGGGPQLALRMRRISEAEARDVMPRRPQYPGTVVPYEQRDILVPCTRGDETIRVPGVLTLPRGTGPFPAVVMLSAIGRHDADHLEHAHKPFLVLADRLARAGIASMRLEELGAPDPYLAFQVQVSTSQLAGEAVEAIGWLAEQPSVDANRIALLGMNEGCSVAAGAAARMGSKVRIAAAALLAPQGMTGIDQIRAEFAESMKREGESAEFVAARVRTFMRPYELMLEGATEDAIVDAFFEELTQQHTARRQQVGEWTPEQRRELAMQQRQVVNTPTFMEMLRFDPAPALRALRCPVLAVLGGRDTRYPAELNEPLVETALAERGAPTRMVVLSDANHRLQPAQTGSIDEMEQIETTIDERALAALIEFLTEHLKPAPAAAQEK